MMAEVDIEKEWKLLWEALDMSAKELNGFLRGGLPVAAQRGMKKFVKAFDNVKAIAERLDGAIVTPIEPLTVEMPWQDVEFRALWAYWKDYRLEKFHVVYKSREEIKALEYLNDIANKDVEKAKDFLNFAMAKGYRSFFVPSVNAKYQPEININEDGDKPFSG